MYPFYRSLDSYPHKRIQIPCTPSYHLNFEDVPSQVKMDPARSPVSYESWPYGGNYGYPIPMGCHGCCNHTYFPGYYSFRPPYPHFLPPSPVYFHGRFPAVSASYPGHSTPLPHYSMELPGYEYDKNSPGDHHCCGCSNHPHNRREDTNVKIEARDPDVEKKSNDSSVPVEFKNYTYPIVWFPPGYMENKEKRKPIESELKERNNYPCDTKAYENLKSSEEPSVWNGWFPFDMNSLGSLKHDGDGRSAQNNQNENKSQFPFPIFWMPYKPEEVERNYQREATNGKKSVEESPSNISPLIASEENSSRGSGMVEKSTDQETNPVKQLEQHEEKRTTSEDAKRKTRTFPVKPIEENGEKKPFENSTKRQSSFPTMASKLPPVCLRVDPLPRRKSGNGSSRSPSPPRQERSLDSSCSSKSSISSSVEGNTQQESQYSDSLPNKTKEEDSNRRNRKVIEVVEGITGRDKNEDCKANTRSQFPLNLPLDSQEEVSTGKTTGIGYDVSEVKEDKRMGDAEEQNSEGIDSKCATVEGQSGNDGSEIGEHKGSSNVKDEKFEEAVEEKRKSLSEAEAAVIIQSSYRGFEVRKWEPLKKLKRIAQVREQVTEVQSCIQALESSDIQIDDKQRVVIGETIMSLLLKLDTIQGLHPSIRDVRKSVARELVRLQEKLDSLSVEKFGVSTANPVENLSSGDDVCIHGGQKEAEEIVLKDNLSESNHDSQSYSVESCQDQPLHVTDATSGSQGVETTDLALADKQLWGEFENNINESPVAKGVDSNPVESDSVTTLKKDETEVLDDDDQGVMSKVFNENHDELELEQCVELPLPVAVEKMYSMAEASSIVGDSIPTYKDLEINQLMELPQGVFEGGPAVEDSRKNVQIESGTDEIPGGVESNASIEITLMDDEVVNGSNLEHQPLDSLMEGLVTVALEDKVRSDKDKELFQAQAQGRQSREISRLDELPEVSKIEEDVGSKKADKPLDILELAGQPQEVTNTDVLEDASKAEESQPEHPLVAHKDHLKTDVDDRSLLLEPQPEFSFGDNEFFDPGHRECYEVTGTDDNSLGPASKIEEHQHELSFADKEIHDGEHKEAGGMTDADENFSRFNDKDNISQRKAEAIEEIEKCNMDLKIVIGEEDQELSEGRLESKKLESATGNVKMIDQPCASETAEEVALGLVQSPPSSGELSFMSPTVSEVSLGGNMVSESDGKLIQENEKLREMMEQLIEAGKEQLIAISNLTGRVKDLEKKLARKKKLKSRRIRAATSGSSCCLRTSNNSFKGTAVDLAM